jgi:hypothetical protein
VKSIELCERGVNPAPFHRVETRINGRILRLRCSVVGSPSSHGDPSATSRSSRTAPVAVSPEHVCFHRHGALFARFRAGLLLQGANAGGSQRAKLLLPAPTGPRASGTTFLYFMHLANSFQAGTARAWVNEGLGECMHHGRLRLLPPLMAGRLRGHLDVSRSAGAKLDSRVIPSPPALHSCELGSRRMGACQRGSTLLAPPLGFGSSCRRLGVHPKDRGGWRAMIRLRGRTLRRGTSRPTRSMVCDPSPRVLGARAGACRCPW